MPEAYLEIQSWLSRAFHPSFFRGSSVANGDLPVALSAEEQNDRVLILGNATFLNSLGVETAALEAKAETLWGEGATVINIAIEGKLAGVLAIADPVKQSTPAALKALAAEGIKVIMLTGDNRTTRKGLPSGWASRMSRRRCFRTRRARS